MKRWLSSFAGRIHRRGRRFMRCCHCVFATVVIALVIPSPAPALPLPQFLLLASGGWPSWIPQTLPGVSGELFGNSGGSFGAFTPPAARSNLYVGNFITPQDCGAYGDDSHDDTNAIEAMFTVAGGGFSSLCPNFASGGSWSIHFPHATYKVTSDIIVDIGAFSSNLRSDGLKILASDGGFDIDGRTITATPTFELRCTGAGACDNVVFGDGGRITIKGENSAGPVFVLGNPTLADSFAGPDINYVIPQNYSTGSTASGAQINTVNAGGRIRVWGAYTNTGGASGYGVEVTNVSASYLDLQANWNASPQTIYLTNSSGSVVGNVIKASFSGSGGTGIAIDQSQVQNNTIFAAFPGVTTGVNATAGSNNVLENPYWVGTPTHFSGSVGITEFDATIPYQSAIPSSGATVNITDPQVYPETTLMLVQSSSLAALTIDLSRCNSSYDGRKINIGTQNAISAVTWGVQTAGVVVGTPSSLAAGQTASLQCRGGEGVWRPI
jgi:hypothetical protein